jgi:hypothetical protein
MRAGGADWLRNIQYSRTASFRAMATTTALLSTVPPHTDQALLLPHSIVACSPTGS